MISVKYKERGSITHFYYNIFFNNKYLVLAPYPTFQLAKQALMFQNEPTLVLLLVKASVLIKSW